VDHGTINKEQKMIEGNFSKWVHINNKDELIQREELKRAGHYVPGIYAIAYSNVNLSAKEFDYIEDIVYFGMSINKRGLQGRLYQFFRTINGKSKQHTGAEKMAHELIKENKDWLSNLYISLLPCIYCSVNFISPEGVINPDDCINLNYMGDIAKQEYACLYEYAKRYNKLPRFCGKPK
jgi:hypothetical protein